MSRSADGRPGSPRPVIYVSGAPQALARAIRLRCPRCGLAGLFRGRFTMLARCPVCHLRFEREQGYFVGAIYLNYAATVLAVLGGYFATEYFARLSLGQHVVLWGGFALLFPVWFYRYSKSVWLALDYFVDPAGGEEDDG